MARTKVEVLLARPRYNVPTMLILNVRRGLDRELRTER
jgi:hypothetical protein